MKINLISFHSLSPRSSTTIHENPLYQFLFIVCRYRALLLSAYLPTFMSHRSIRMPSRLVNCVLRLVSWLATMQIQLDSYQLVAGRANGKCCQDDNWSALRKICFFPNVMGREKVSRGDLQ
jgi:hypothetical protein